MCVEGVRDLDKDTAIAILDVIENYLFNNKCIIDNPEREDAIMEGADPDEIAVLYGEDYFKLEDRIAELLSNVYRRVGDYDR